MTDPLEPEIVRTDYAQFLAPGRVLLSGHSHQAWPDVAREGVLEAFADAARLADDKWGAAFEKADIVRQAVASRIGAAADEIALASNTHELVCRFLSALDLRRRPHLVTTGGEFHSLHRQLRRLSEEGIAVDFVAPQPVTTLAARLAASVRDDTAAVMASTVLFETSSVVPGIVELVERAHAVGAEVLLDAYHAFGVVPFTLAELGPDPIFVTAGGYKYAQWGEGCCFLRVPSGCTLRPVLTGWFADFASLGDRRTDGPVGYGPRGADRFAGATYDPISHYRAARVIAHFDARGWNVPRLAATYRRQTERIRVGLEGFDVVTPASPTERGGFVAIRVPQAGDVVSALRERDIVCDSRGELLRLGPAPYVTDQEIDRGVQAVVEIVGRR